MEPEIFQGRNGRWYWRCRAANGKIIASAAGGKENGYARETGARRGWERFVASVCVWAADQRRMA